MRLHDFSVLSFDCYGTLIDWETGILQALRPLLVKLDAAPAHDEVLAAYARFEGVQQRATPTKAYSDILAIVYKRLAETWGVPAAWDECRTFGVSVAHWPAFPDSAAALAELSRHFKLVVLSNVDNASFAASNAKLGVAFDAIYTAEETGAYKPDRTGFDYMIERLAERGIQKAAILHTAQSLHHDHGTAAALGLARCWIDRHAGKRGGVPASAPTPDFRFTSLAELLDAYREEAR